MTKGKGEKRTIKDTPPNTSQSPPRNQSESDEMEALTKSVYQMIDELKSDKEARKKEFQDIKNLLADKQTAWEEEWRQERDARMRLEQSLDRLENAERRRNLLMSNYVKSLFRELLKKKKEMSVVRDGKNVPIYIEEDLSREDRMIQKKAREECKLLREQGKEAYVGHRRIHVDGKERRWDKDESE